MNSKTTGFTSATGTALQGPSPNDAHAPSFRQECCSIATARRVAAMLDLDTDFLGQGDALPRGWHFVLMAADTPRSQLRGDGFPGLGVPMPDLGLPRLMLGGRSVSMRRDIPIGAAVERHSAITQVARKTGAAGDMAVVTLSHALRLPDDPEPALLEVQTYLLLPARTPQSTAPDAPVAGPVRATHVKTVVPDETLLFQYSALGFNSHRIHLDRAHAVQVEGFPDLVVNGGLSTLLLTEFLRVELGLCASSFKVRHVAPLYCNRSITMSADPADDGWRLRAFNDQNQIAVDMEVSVR